MSRKKTTKESTSGPLPPPFGLPPERWPFAEILSLPGQEDDETAMYWFMHDTGEWLAMDAEDAARIRLAHPGAMVTIDPKSYGN